MNTYEFHIHGANLKVRIVDDLDLALIGVSELKSQFGTTVVGIMAPNSPGTSALLLSVGTNCLILQLPTESMHTDLVNFLADSDICFVGIDIDKATSRLKGYRDLRSFTGTELSVLAARVLQKPKLKGCGGLEEIAAEVGISLLEDQKGEITSSTRVGSIEWEECFSCSVEQINCAIRHAHACYLIGNKLLGYFDV